MKINEKMTIVNRLGLHLRAAAELVKVANKFKCQIVVKHGIQNANAKSLMGLMTLAAAVSMALGMSSVAYANLTDNQESGPGNQDNYVDTSGAGGDGSTAAEDSRAVTDNSETDNNSFNLDVKGVSANLGNGASSTGGGDATDDTLLGDGQNQAPHGDRRDDLNGPEDPDQMPPLLDVRARRSKDELSAAESDDCGKNGAKG